MDTNAGCGSDSVKKIVIELEIHIHSLSHSLTQAPSR